MSIFSLGARSAVLAVMLVLGVTANASAGTYASGCVLNHNQSCFTTERHTYDSHYAEAPSEAYYIASWLSNPADGSSYSLLYDWGDAGVYIGTNTSTFLDGGWGNFSGSNGVWIIGIFDY